MSPDLVTSSVVAEIQPDHDSTNADPAFDPDRPPEMDPEWQTKSKHIFVLSEAGKPIYTL